MRQYTKSRFSASSGRIIMPWRFYAHGGRWMLKHILCALLLVSVPVVSHAALYWDDQLENFGGPNEFSNWPVLPDPVMTVDPTVKLSGAGSLRYNYYPLCQTAGPAQPCGGWSDRTFPQTNEHYGRVYIRVSQNFQWGAPNGQTKIFGVRSTTGLSKLWFNFYFGLGMIVSAENTPVDGSTRNIPINISMPREQWVCFEWHYIANTPGVPNGTIEVWKDGVRTVSRNDIQWRGPTNTSALDFIRMYRQSGFENLWFDRMAVGSTRVGCIGTQPASTPPAPPTSLTAQ